MQIQMVDLKKQFAEIRDEVVAAVTDVLDSGQYVLGPRVRELEGKVAEYCGAKEAAGVASGTDALHLAIDALSIGEGDEVITTPFTFFATVEAILYVGATPVFVDIDLDTFNIDADKIEEKITSKTKAIVPVHMFGHPADMTKIMSIAGKHGLSVVEDCAQAFGASIEGKRVGSFGNAGGFSFYPSKNLGAVGDGGMITCGDAALMETIRALRNHGSRSSYKHESLGFNSRLDEIQAAILLVKFKRIDRYIEMRRKNAKLYDGLFAGKITAPIERDGAVHVYHQYTIRSSRRDAIKEKLGEAGIASTVYYPIAVHLQDAVKDLGYKRGDLPNAELAADEVLSLPMYPELEGEEISKIAEIVLGA